MCHWPVKKQEAAGREGPIKVPRMNSAEDEFHWKLCHVSCGIDMEVHVYKCI